MIVCSTHDVKVAGLVAVLESLLPGGGKVDFVFVVLWRVIQTCESNRKQIGSTIFPFLFVVMLLVVTCKR